MSISKVINTQPTYHQTKAASQSPKRNMTEEEKRVRYEIYKTLGILLISAMIGLFYASLRPYSWNRKPRIQHFFVAMAISAFIGHVVVFFLEKFYHSAIRGFGHVYSSIEQVVRFNSLIKEQDKCIEELQREIKTTRARMDEQNEIQLQELSRMQRFVNERGFSKQ